MNRNALLLVDMFDEDRYMIYAIANSFQIPVQDIEDILQEAFARIISHYEHEMTRREIHLLIIKVIRNLCIDYWRRRHALPIDYTNPPDLEGDIYERIVDDESDPEQRMLAKELQGEIADAVRALPPIYFQTFVLIRIRGLAVNEVSALLSVSVETVRQRLYRACDKIEERLAANGEVWVSYKRLVKKK